MKFLTSLFVLCVLALAAPAAWFEPLCPCPSDCRCLAGSCRCGPAAAQDWCCEGCDCKGVAGVRVEIRRHPRHHRHRRCCAAPSPAPHKAATKPALEVIEHPQK
jgi:hypothetical protein